MTAAEVLAKYEKETSKGARRHGSKAVITLRALRVLVKLEDASPVVLSDPQMYPATVFMLVESLAKELDQP